MFKAIALVGIKLYQIFLSPVLPRSCRFYPSCSQYCYQSIEKYGIFKGTFKTIYRLLKCNPWNKGGINLP